MVDFATGMMLQNPTATHTIGPTRLKTIFMFSLGVWGFFALVLLAICVYHALSRADFAIFHLACIIFAVVICASYVRLDGKILHVWGPLAVNLGIALSTGIRAAWRSPNGTTFRSFVESFLPNRNNNNGSDTIPLQNLQQSSRGDV